MSPLFQLVYSTAYSLDEFQLVLFNNCLIQLLIPWMSPLFQLVYSTAYGRPVFGRTFYSTTGFIQLFIPMAALIWSHFLFNNWFYSTVLFNCLFNFLFRWPPLFGHTFYSTGLFNYFIQLEWPPLFGHPYFILITTDSFFFFFFFSGKKGALPGFEPGTLDLQSGCLDR